MDKKIEITKEYEKQRKDLELECSKELGILIKETKGKCLERPIFLALDIQSIVVLKANDLKIDWPSRYVIEFAMNFYADIFMCLKQIGTEQKEKAILEELEKKGLH